MLTPLDKQILELCKKGEWLKAVKLYKESSGDGLKESKEYVDQLAIDNGIEKTKGCFIATACYGDYDAPEVKMLRNYRDEKLLHTRSGRIFVKFYYFISPSIARQLDKSDSIKRFVRSQLLNRILERIKY